MRDWKPAVAIAAVACTLSGCVASSNFYTGRTLEEGKAALTVGLDDIAMGSRDESVTVTKTSPLSPSIGGAVGLPLRLELGLRYFPPEFFEGTLRDQINPRSFTAFDVSLDLHYAVLFGGYSYFRYGATLSKNIHEFEPYVHYSAYAFAGSAAGEFDGSVTGITDAFFHNLRSVGFGIGLPLRSLKVFPEMDYDYVGGDIRHGLWHFGVGFRVYTN